MRHACRVLRETSRTLAAGHWDTPKVRPRLIGNRGGREEAGIDRWGCPCTWGSSKHQCVTTGATSSCGAGGGEVRHCFGAVRQSSTRGYSARVQPHRGVGGTCPPLAAPPVL